VKKESLFFIQKRAGPKSCRNTLLRVEGRGPKVHNHPQTAVQSQMYRKFAGVM
jgi:hypothetical protein